MSLFVILLQCSSCYLIWPSMFISIGILFFCAKKKAPPGPGGTKQQSTKALNKNEGEGQPPNFGSGVDAKKNKSKSKAAGEVHNDKAKSKSKPIDVKKKSNMVPPKSKEQAKSKGPPADLQGKTDPFGDDDVDSANPELQVGSTKKKKVGKKGGELGMPNKDGYDDLNPNKGANEGETKSKMNTEETKSKMVDKDGGYDNIDPTKNANPE